jgi:hypothetical protein
MWVGGIVTSFNGGYERLWLVNECGSEQQYRREGVNARDCYCANEGQYGMIYSVKVEKRRGRAARHRR